MLIEAAFKSVPQLLLSAHLFLHEQHTIASLSSTLLSALSVAFALAARETGDFQGRLIHQPASFVSPTFLALLALRCIELLTRISALALVIFWWPGAVTFGLIVLEHAIVFALLKASTSVAGETSETQSPSKNKSVHNDHSSFFQCVLLFFCFWDFRTQYGRVTAIRATPFLVVRACETAVALACVYSKIPYWQHPLARWWMYSLVCFALLVLSIPHLSGRWSSDSRLRAILSTPDKRPRDECVVRYTPAAAQAHTNTTPAHRAVMSELSQSPWLLRARDSPLRNEGRLSPSNRPRSPRHIRPDFSPTITQLVTSAKTRSLVRPPLSTPNSHALLASPLFQKRRQLLGSPKATSPSIRSRVDAML